MVEFKRNPDSPMSPLVAELSEQDMLDLAAYYSGLAPPPVDPAAEPAPVDATLARRGEQLYMTGDPPRASRPVRAATATMPAATPMPCAPTATGTRRIPPIPPSAARSRSTCSPSCPLTAPARPAPPPPPPFQPAT